MLLFYFLAALVGIGTAHQVVIPHLRGRPIFPSWRRASLKQLMAAKSDLVDAENELAEAQIRKQAAETRVTTATIGSEISDLDMKADRIREGFPETKIEPDRQLAGGTGDQPAPSNGSQAGASVQAALPNGETTH